MWQRFIKKLSTNAQAQMGMWLTDTFADAHDTTQYDSQIVRLLDELNITYQDYTVVPGFDYANPTLERWDILVNHNGAWESAHLLNPFYSAQHANEKIWQQQSQSHRPINPSEAI